MNRPAILRSVSGERTARAPRPVVARPRRRAAGAATLALVAVLLPAGCDRNRGATPAEVVEPGVVRATARTLEFVSHVGGAHHRTVVRADRWFQTFSNQLLVLDRNDGSIVSRLPLAPLGTTGAAVDLAIKGDRLFVVLERDAVVEIAIAGPAPAIVEAVDALTLGVRPLRVGVVGDEVYVAGEGGVVRWSDRHRSAQGLEGAACGSLALTDQGPAVCAGRRVVRVEDGSFLGAASELLQLPPDAGAPLAFVLQGPSAATVGLMDGSVRERAAEVLPGVVRRIRWFDGRLWAVAETEIVSWAIVDSRLVDRQAIRVKGARDLDMLSVNVLAVSGIFGRAMYRRAADRGRAGDEFFGAVREASGLSKAVNDGRRILAGNDDTGFWLYLIGGSAELTDRRPGMHQLPPQIASGVWGKAEVADGAKVVRIAIDGQTRDYSPDGSPDIYTVAAVDEALWIGHSWGIDVIGRGELGGVERIGTLRLDGPVRYIVPKWDKGTAFVAELGGFGVARIRSLSEPAPPPAPPSERRTD